MHAEPTKPRPVSAFRSWHNHMRADHPKLWHPIRITIVVITVWWILFCLLLAYSIGDQLFRQLVLGTSNSNPVAIIAMVSLVLMLGCGLRWNATMTASRAEAEQAKTRLREMESRNHIAEAIHDAVTGDLSAAAFVAQRRIDALSGGDDGDGSASTDGDDGKNADERRDELDKWT